MNEAPKKIWAIQGTHHPYWRLKEFPNTVQYIRADLVDGLVEALEKIAGGWVCVDEAGLTARAALKALEDPDV